MHRLYKPLGRFTRPRSLHQQFRQQRHHRQRKHQREQHRSRQRQRESGEEFPHRALKKSQREENHHGSERGADDGTYQFLRAFFGRQCGVFSAPQMAVDVFHHHHRIIDHQADGDGQPSQRHQIERAAEQADKKECRYHGQRQARRRHQGDSPIPQESKQNHHRQKPADQDSVADARHGLPYEFRQVVHRGNVQRGWNQIFAAISDLLHLLGNLVDVATDLACHVDQRRRPAVAGDQCSAVGGAFADQRNVAQPHRAGSLGADHRVADIVQALELRVRQRQILLIVFIQPPHAGHLVARP